ncbi:MAG: GNAT family N-acetyltransferase [Dehalococcoidales bacterium]
MEKASQMFTRAFYNDPFSLYAFPDTKERDSRLIYMNEMSLRYGMRYGMVYAPSERIEGGAIWMPPGKATLSILGFLLSGGITPIIKMGLKTELKMLPLDKFMEQKHRKLVPYPHWYLALLGVDPQYQKQGYAGKLLRPMLEKLDNENMPCYLETSSEKNYLMYRHFGFEIIDEYVLPKADIKLWAMLRKAND